jgi:hypothetical protein
LPYCVASQWCATQSWTPSLAVAEYPLLAAANPADAASALATGPSLACTRPPQIAPVYPRPLQPSDRL